MTNVVSGGRAPQVIQAAHIGTVNINPARDHDIDLVISHESKEIPVAPGEDERFYLHVTNQSSRPRWLVFRVDGAPGITVLSEDSIDPVEVVPGTPRRLTLVVRCGDVEPMAGPYQLRVLAAEAETEPGQRTWWRSDPRTIMVRSRPVLRVRLEQPGKRVSDAGDYPSCVRVWNKGNTGLAGEVRVTPEEGGPTLTFPDGASFTLEHLQDHVDIPVIVTIPTQEWNDRSWEIPADVVMKRDDVDRTDVSLDIAQFGFRSDLGEWVGSKREWAHGVLVVWAAVLFVLGLVAGRLLTPTPSIDEPVKAAVPQTIPLSVENATPPSEPAYEPVPCDAGTSVVLLKSMKADEASRYAKSFVELESARLAAILQPQYKIYASKREQLCPRMLGTDTPAEYTVFVWLGPVPSTDAPKVCETIGKPKRHDCYPIPAV